MSAAVIRVDQLTLHQVQRRPPVEHDVVERVRDDLGDPHEARLHVTNEEQVDRAEQEAADPDRRTTSRRRAARTLRFAVAASKQAEQRRVDPQQRG